MDTFHGGTRQQGETLGGRGDDAKIQFIFPPRRAIHAVEVEARTIRAACQMRFGDGEVSGADKSIWVWLLRHAGWQISRYKPKGNGMTARKRRPTASTAAMKWSFLPGSRSQDIMLYKEEISGKSATQCLSRTFGPVRSETSDEHIVRTPGGRGVLEDDSST